jgi:SSS family solute:Na+ symporter
MIGFSVVIVLIDFTEIFFKLNFATLPLLLIATLIMSAFVAFITTFYVKYDEEAQTLGLTIWSVRQAQEWFKGRKLNEREGENVIANWKLVDTDNEDVINFSHKDMHKMQAEPGDLVYITDTRKWLGGLKSCHTVYGQPHDETGIVYIRKIHLEKGLFVEHKPIQAEKEM